LRECALSRRTRPELTGLATDSRRGPQRHGDIAVQFRDAEHNNAVVLANYLVSKLDEV